MRASIGESDDEPAREQQLHYANDSEKEFEQAVRAGPQVIHQALSDELRAEFVGQVVRHRQWPPGSTLQIADATIRGTLDLTDLALPALVLRHCKFDTLKLDDSHAPSIELQQRCTGQQISARRLAVSGDLRVIEVQLIRDNRNGAASPGDREGERRDEADWRALDCYRLKAGGDVELQAVTVEEGRIDFSGADIKGRFTCSGSLSNPGQVALTCDGMDVGGSMYVGRLHDLLRPGTEMPGLPDITGGVRLVGAHIRGEVNFTGLKIDNAGGTALDAEHLTVGSHLYLDQLFKAVGLVKLTGVNAGRQVNCTNGSFHGNGEGCAINADGLVTDSLYLNSLGVRNEDKFIAQGCIRLVGAKVRQVLCTGAIITSFEDDPSLCADRIEAGDIYLDSVQVTGVVELTGAHIRDRIVCTKGKFKRPDPEAAPNPKAINLDGTSAARLLLDQGFDATGEVSLVGATVSVEFNCTSGKFFNRRGYALKAIRSTCGEVYLDGEFAAEGAVSFQGATLTRVDCRKGFFRAEEVKAPSATPDAGPNPTYALDLSETTINGHVLGDKLKVEGGLSLRNAHISRDLDLTNAHLTSGNNKSRMVLDGHGLTVDGTLDWQLAERPQGKVDVSHAKVGRLRDDVHSWPAPESGQQSADDLVLDGFRYGSLEDIKGEKEDGKGEGKTVWSLENRKKWLKSSNQFSSQPYEELARVYRETGKAHDAQQVTIQEERQRRKCGGLSPPSKAWSWFLDITVGYGYKPYKILIGFVALEIAGICFFSYAQQQGIMEAVALPGTAQTAQTASADKCTANYPCFYPVVYSAELLLPVVNLRQVQYWLPDTEKPWGIGIMIFTWFTILFGWIGVTALVGGLSRIWQRT